MGTCTYTNNIHRCTGRLIWPWTGLGLVDLNFTCSTVCPILPGLMGTWQKRLGKMVELPNQSQPTQVHDQMNYPVVDKSCQFKVVQFLRSREDRGEPVRRREEARAVQEVRLRPGAGQDEGHEQVVPGREQSLLFVSCNFRVRKNKLSKVAKMRQDLSVTGTGARPRQAALSDS